MERCAAHGIAAPDSSRFGSVTGATHQQSSDATPLRQAAYSGHVGPELETRLPSMQSPSPVERGGSAIADGLEFTVDMSQSLRVSSRRFPRRWYDPGGGCEVAYAALRTSSSRTWPRSLRSSNCATRRSFHGSHRDGRFRAGLHAGRSG